MEAVLKSISGWGWVLKVKVCSWFLGWVFPCRCAAGHRDNCRQFVSSFILYPAEYRHWSVVSHSPGPRCKQRKWSREVVLAPEPKLFTLKSKLNIYEISCENVLNKQQANTASHPLAAGTRCGYMKCYYMFLLQRPRARRRVGGGWPDIGLVLTRAVVCFYPTLGHSHNAETREAFVPAPAQSADI